jgi:hypothetical protein
VRAGRCAHLADIGTVFCLRCSTLGSGAVHLKVLQAGLLSAAPVSFARHHTCAFTACCALYTVLPAQHSASIEQDARPMCHFGTLHWYTHVFNICCAMACGAVLSPSTAQRSNVSSICMSGPQAVPWHQVRRRWQPGASTPAWHYPGAGSPPWQAGHPAGPQHRARRHMASTAGGCSVPKQKDARFYTCRYEAQKAHASQGPQHRARRNTANTSERHSAQVLRASGAL